MTTTWSIIPQIRQIRLPPADCIISDSFVQDQKFLGDNHIYGICMDSLEGLPVDTKNSFPYPTKTGAVTDWGPNSYAQTDPKEYYLSLL